MTRSEDEIVRSANQICSAGTRKEEAYGWAKREHWNRYGWQQDSSDYEKFIKALCATLRI